MGSFATTFVGFIVVLIIIHAARIWWMMRMSGHGRRMGRIADGDDHLSFDERIAERMRELEREKALAQPVERAAPSSTPLAQREAPSAPRPTFGRRAL